MKRVFVKLVKKKKSKTGDQGSRPGKRDFTKCQDMIVLKKPAKDRKCQITEMT